MGVFRTLMNLKPKVLKIFNLVMYSLMVMGQQCFLNHFTELNKKKVYLHKCLGEEAGCRPEKENMMFFTAWCSAFLS